MIYSPALTAQILAAVQSILESNNGYADIGNDAALADALVVAGYVVIRSTTLHGAPTLKGFTAASQKALAASPYGVSTYKPITHASDGPDYEGMILARQERRDEF